MTFWGILLLQAFTIFITDNIWVRNISKNNTIWEQIVHAMVKSHFPLPFINWHEGEGDCNDHVKRKKAVQCEVLVTTAINFIFNIALLSPLVILCKKTTYLVDNSFVTFIDSKTI